MCHRLSHRPCGNHDTIHHVAILTSSHHPPRVHRPESTASSPSLIVATGRHQGLPDGQTARRPVAMWNKRPERVVGVPFHRRLCGSSHGTRTVARPYERAFLPPSSRSSQEAFEYGTRSDSNPNASPRWTIKRVKTPSEAGSVGLNQTELILLRGVEVQRHTSPKWPRVRTEPSQLSITGEGETWRE
ncbi:hypothetical protein MMC07_004844 [Pseudocyphellaria aurata]|nr:hypothetical protein [Pseudocyphellaria aurata]